MSSRSRSRSRSPVEWRRSRDRNRSRSRSRSRSPSPPAAASSRAVRRGHSRSPSRSPSRGRSVSRSRSRSRSWSRGRGRGRSYERGPVDKVPLSHEDSAFVVGRGGMCKAKLARVSGASLHFNEADGVVEVRGTELQRRRAVKYIKLVMAQRVGPVYLSPEENDDNDLTIVTIPGDCIGYVTGKNGSTMRRFEEEWGTLVFFIEHKPLEASKGGTGRLAIFGDRRGRRGTELKVMSAVETKSPGWFTKDVTEKLSDEEWGTDTIRIQDDELSYALGKGGVTRRKLARASCCIMEYVGNFAFICGTRAERKRCRDYLNWLLLQRRGPVIVEDAESRDDVLIGKVPSSCVAYVTGIGGRTLRRIEEETGTFCFIDGNRRGENERLLIFGGTESERRRAKRMIDDMVKSKLTLDREYGTYNPRTGRRSFSHGRSRSRSRSRSHSRGRGRSRSRSHSRRRHHNRSPSYGREREQRRYPPSSHRDEHRYERTESRREAQRDSRSKKRSPSPSRSLSRSPSRSRSRSPSRSRSRSRSRSPETKKPRRESMSRSRSNSPAPVANKSASASVSGSKPAETRQ